MKQELAFHDPNIPLKCLEHFPIPLFKITLKGHNGVTFHTAFLLFSNSL